MAKHVNDISRMAGTGIDQRTSGAVNALYSVCGLGVNACMQMLGSNKMLSKQVNNARRTSHDKYVNVAVGDTSMTFGFDLLREFRTLDIELTGNEGKRAAQQIISAFNCALDVNLTELTLTPDDAADLSGTWGITMYESAAYQRSYLYHSGTLSAMMKAVQRLINETCFTGKSKWTVTGVEVGVNRVIVHTNFTKLNAKPVYRPFVS